MNTRQKSILIGSILGDGSVNKSGGFTIAASIKHLDYLEWKYKELKDLGAGQITTYSRLDKRHNRIYTTCRFYIGGLKDFRFLFYPEGGKKSIPSTLTLDPLAFAVWFFDDGTLVCGSGFSLATCGFPRECLGNAIKALKSIDLEGKITKDGRIYLNATNKNRVIEYVIPIVVPSMKHKLEVRANAVYVGQVVKSCLTCSIKFESYESDNKTYCSRQCAYASRKTGYNTRTETKMCPICGEDFTPYVKRQKTCIDCRDKPFPDELCKICGNPVKRRGNVCCSIRCSVIANHIARGHKIHIEI